MEEFLKNSVEIQSFGFNLLTISFFGTLFFSCFQCWSLFNQGKRIWFEKNGNSVSIIQFGYWASYFVSVVPYGYYVKSVALLFNGFVGIFCIFILVGLWRFKKAEYYEWPFVVVFFLIFYFMISEDMNVRHLIFSIALFGILLFGIFQVYELWKKKDVGAIDVRVQKVFIATSSFWLVYAVATWNIPLIIFNPISIVMNIFILYLYKRYRITDK